MTAETINIRSIQHYMYCPRRFALLETNRDWEENAFVVKADILHSHVHDGSHSFSNSRKIVRNSVSIFNDLPEYDLYGVTDCIEFIRDKNGVEITNADGRFRVSIVEYKPRSPKDNAFNETDVIQVFAQKICADYVWNTDSEAYIYYCDTKKRVKLPFDSEYEAYDKKLRELLCKMRELLESGKIPNRIKGQKCSGCSMADICFPKDCTYNVKDIIMSMKEGEP